MPSNPQPRVGFQPGRALRWLGTAVPPEYLQAVADLRALAINLGPYDRPTARTSAPFSTSSGSKLVRPPAERLVPVEDDMPAHVAAARVLPFPAKDLIWDQPNDIWAAARECVMHGRGIVAWRDARAARVRRIAQTLAPYGKWIASLAPPTVAFLVADMNLAFMAAFIDAVEWPDIELVKHFVQGFPIVGDIADSGLFRPQHTPATIPVASFTPASNRAYRSQATSQVASAAADPLNQPVTDELDRLSRKEAAEGLAFGPLTATDLHRQFGENAWRTQVRFGTVQSNGAGGVKIRAIDNAKAALLNAAATTHETIKCITVEFAAACAALVLMWCCVLQISMVALGIGFDDMRSAYRRIPTCHPYYTVFAVWDVQRERVVYYYLPGHQFGSIAAVLNFNRFPKLMVRMARVLFAVMVDQYFDDYMTVDTAVGLTSAQDSLILCHDLVGPDLIEYKKHKALADSNVGLGHEIDVSFVRREHAVYVRCTPDRIEKVLHAFTVARAANFMSPGDASTVRGKLGFLLSASCGKVGRAATQPLLQREYFDSDYSFGAAMRSMADFFEALLPRLPALRIPIEGDPRPPVILYTDAMYNPPSARRSAPFSQIGIALFHPDAAGPRHGTLMLPPWVYGYLSSDDKTLIMQAEMIAPLSALMSAPAAFAGRKVIIFIDNTGALSSLLHGYSSKPDAARLCNLFHLFAAAIGCSIYFEWVPTKANIADLPSRATMEAMRRYFSYFPHSRVLPLVPPDASTWNAPLGGLFDMWLQLPV